jgi:hypothetical protein
MAELTRQSLTDYRIRNLSTKLLHLFYATTYIEWVQSVHAHMQTVFSFVGEPDEMLMTPSRMMDELDARSMIFGDCDDVAMLIAALAISIGLQARFRAVFESEDGYFQHVFAEVKLPDERWIEIDPTAPLHRHRAWVGNSLTVGV